MTGKKTGVPIQNREQTMFSLDEVERLMKPDLGALKVYLDAKWKPGLPEHDALPQWMFATIHGNPDDYSMDLWRLCDSHGIFNDINVANIHLERMVHNSQPIEAFEILRNRGHQFEGDNFSALSDACYSHNIRLVKYFLGIGLNPNGSPNSNALEVSFAKALRRDIAQDKECVEIVLLLLEAGADITPIESDVFDSASHVRNEIKRTWQAERNLLAAKTNTSHSPKVRL